MERKPVRRCGCKAIMDVNGEVIGWGHKGNTLEDIESKEFSNTFFSASCDAALHEAALGYEKDPIMRKALESVIASIYGNAGGYELKECPKRNLDYDSVRRGEKFKHHFSSKGSL